MKEYEQLIARLGEVGTQAIIENWERHVGVKRSRALPLEERWIAFFVATTDYVRAVA